MSATNEPGAGLPARRGGILRRGNARRQGPPPTTTAPALPILVVTTDTLPGYGVTRVLGEVIGVLARPRNPYAEGVKNLSGKSVDSEVSGAALTRWRQEAVARMAQHAHERGANAVIGLRFDHRDITGAWGEICAYGTAVVVERMDRHDPRTFGASWPQ
jgi:uncharacterized protein YbjQ (UPF0145 family)